MRLNDDELLMVIGGAVSATLINAFIKGISILIDLGKSFGSSIRRATSNTSCEIN